MGPGPCSPRSLPMNFIEWAVVGVCRVLLWISTSVIFIILVANTVLRYATGTSLQWANEVPELLFPWLVMSGVVLAAAPPALRRGASIGSWLVVAALYGTLARATCQMLEIVHDEKSPILQVPGSLTYGCVMGGLVMLALLALKSAWNAWATPPVPSAPNAETAVPEAHW